jgi:hypothetical protein
VTVEQRAFLIRATKLTLVTIFAYACASMVAGMGVSTTISVLRDLPLHLSRVLDIQLAAVAGAFALPFVMIAKSIMFLGGSEGAVKHAIAGLVVGLSASVLFIGQIEPAMNLGFALAGLLASLTYLGARNLGRRVVRW